MTLDLSDHVVSEYIYVHGYWEAFETKLISDCLHADMTFIDVGAHIGYYSLLAARKVGTRGKVIAFEPAPDNFALLTENVRRNRLGNIVVAENLALSDQIGASELYLSAYNTGDHRLFPSTSADDAVFAAGNPRRAVSVDTVSLDSYLRETKQSDVVDVIKIDVQGAEQLVLQGMQNTLGANSNLLLFVEYWPFGLASAGTDPRSILDFLVDRVGFALLRISPERECLISIGDTAEFARISEALDHHVQIDLIATRNPALLNRMIAVET